MTAVQFYQVQEKTPAAVEGVIPKILEKAVAANLKVLILVENDKQAERLSEHLWSYENTSFMAHGINGGANAQQQPILISTEETNVNKAEVLMLVGGVTTNNINGYSKVLNMFNSSENAVTQARAYWKELKEQNLDLTYYAFENNKWHKKA